MHIGRKRREGTGVKRQRTTNTHLFRFPFRPECYKSHLKTQHTNDWELYQTLFHQDKVELFNRKERSGIHLHMDCDKDSLEFAISRLAIVDRVVMDLFFHPKEDKEGEDTEPITKANAMKLFQLQEDGSYVVVIKNSLRFDLAIQHVSAGLSF
ncbi:hypothetical protein BASA61_009637 [Batrachochytrium salamandrivorans]|nr:hypothetical protein BASA61_009637 [Batrachochytrium salamandrivorans]